MVLKVHGCSTMNPVKDLSIELILLAARSPIMLILPRSLDASSLGCKSSTIR